MKKCLFGFWLACIAGSSWSQDSFRMLDDADLSAVHGREGIAMDLEMRVNADQNGNPLQELNYCDGAGNPCRIAFQFHNRGSAGGEWTVWKSYFSLFKINNLWIDADQAPAAASPYPDNRATNRFMNTSNTVCLLDGSSNTTNCHLAARNLPMLALSFNQGNASGLEWFMHLGAVAVEYGSTGFNSDLRGSALGVIVGDTRGLDQSTPTAYAAQFKVGGKIGLYGF